MWRRCRVSYVHLILADSWASPVILVAGKDRGVMFLFLLFLNFHSCSSFVPVHLFHLLYYFVYLLSLSLGDDAKWPTRVDMSLKPNTTNTFNKIYKGCLWKQRTQNENRSLGIYWDTSYYRKVVGRATYAPAPILAQTSAQIDFEDFRVSSVIPRKKNSELSVQSIQCLYISCAKCVLKICVPRLAWSALFRLFDQVCFSLIARLHCYAVTNNRWKIINLHHCLDILSRRHFIWYFFLYFPENKLWLSMQIVFFGTSKSVFWKKIR